MSAVRDTTSSSSFKFYASGPVSSDSIDVFTENKTTKTDLL